MCNTAREIEAATQPLWQWLPQLLSHSATLPEWLPQPLSHSARVAAATRMAEWQSGCGSHSATQPLWQSGSQPLTECLPQRLWQSG